MGCDLSAARRILPVAVLCVASLGAPLHPVEAQGTDDTDSGLSQVRLHFEHFDHSEAGRVAEAVRSGVAALWSAMEPWATQLGLAEFPSADIWVFSDVQTASRVAPFDESFWTTFQGLARPGTAWIRFELPDDPLSSSLRRNIAVLSAHEAAHIVQYALSGSGLTSRCISEGAAEWYARAAVDAGGFEDVGDEVVSQLVDLANFNDWWPQLETSAIFTISTLDGWRTARDGPNGRGLYNICVLAFDLLLTTGGGHDAYFEYLSQRGQLGWRTALGRAFDEDLATVMARFDRYRATNGTDHRLAHEVVRDRFVRNHVLECGPWQPRARCIQ